MSSLVPKRAFLLPLSPLLLDLLLLVDAESKIPLLSSGELAAWELNLSNTDGGLRLPLLNLPSCFLSEFPDSFSALSVCLPSLSKTDIDSWLAPEDIAFFYFLRLTCFHLSLLGGRGGGVVLFSVLLEFRFSISELAMEPVLCFQTCLVAVAALFPFMSSL